MKKLGILLIAILIFSSVGPLKNTKAADLTNAAAFYFTASDTNGQWSVGTPVTAHSNALWNAVTKLNAVSTKIGLWHGSTPIYKTRTLTSHPDDFYGQFDGGPSGGIIYINNQTTTADNFTTCNFNKLALHEFGHAMGLDHQGSASYSVMKQGQYCFNDYTTLDKNNLKYKYGN